VSDIAFDEPIQANPKHKEIKGKLRLALDKMIWEGLDWRDAAREVDLELSAMRKSFAKSSVLSYIRQQRQMLRASISTKNDFRLAQIRDDGNGMPALKAIAMLDAPIDAAAAAQRNGVTPSIGVTIQVLSSQPATRQIEPPIIDAQPVDNVSDN
jgi:hypothetical protein